MALSYADAVAALYQSSQEQFVAERKRLAAELKASGDKAGAAQLAKLPRPPLSAWAVNQLWWHAREAFEALLASAERLRQGERDAATSHREALLTLRGRAALLLAEAGHAVTDATLRRVTTTLTALAAGGGFEPDAPGALAADRDPPGFEALGSVTQWSPSATSTSASSEPRAEAEAAERKPSRPERDAEPPRADAAEAPAALEERERAAVTREHERQTEEERRRQEEERRAAEERRRQEEERRAAEERRRQEERARRAAERARLEQELAEARSGLAAAEAELTRLRGELDRAVEHAARQRSALRDLEARFAALPS